MKLKLMIMKMRYHNFVGKLLNKLHEMKLISDSKFKAESEYHFLMILAMFNEVIQSRIGGA